MKTPLDTFPFCGLMRLFLPRHLLRDYHILLQFCSMTTGEKLESLIQQATELPDEAQAELVQSLMEMRAQHLGIDWLHEDESITVAH